jgi:itaconate CoA-transferase
MRPLDGITVVTLEHAIAAPFCTRQLADLGARVIKVERPGPAISRAPTTARARPGLALRVDQPLQGEPDAGRQARRGAEASWPAARRRPTCWCRTWRPAPPRVLACRTRRCAKHPRLIVCDISGYGSDGPYRDKKAYDLLIQSESGFLSVTGTPTRRPRPAARSPTSRPACTPTATSWPRCCSAAGRARLPHRGVDAGKHGRVDELSAVLRLRRRGAAAARRRRARDHLSLRSVSRRRRQDGDARPAERTRVGRSSAPGARTPDLASDPRYASNALRTAARDELRAADRQTASPA